MKEYNYETGASLTEPTTRFLTLGFLQQILFQNENTG